MNDENRPQQVPANADGNLRETHDDESALHSDWGSDESIHESLGDGRPRDAIDEHQGDPQGRDDPDGILLTESGARGPDSPRVILRQTPTRRSYPQPKTLNDEKFKLTNKTSYYYAKAVAPGAYVHEHASVLIAADSGKK